MFVKMTANGKFSLKDINTLIMQSDRFRTNLEIKYHNVIMGFNPENCKNHAAINTIIMAVKKRICYKDRLKTHDPAYSVCKRLKSVN